MIESQRSDRIFHIASSAAWRKALERGVYPADGLEKGGLIHCCYRSQIRGVASRFFRNEKELVLVEIDVQKLSPDVKEENLEGGQELFPHIYGPINLEAVVAVRQFVPEDILLIQKGSEKDG